MIEANANNDVSVEKKMKMWPHYNMSRNWCNYLPNRLLDPAAHKHEHMEDSKRHMDLL
jgi:hypothetical protein